MKIRITYIVFFVGFGLTMSSYAQSERKLINEGNRMYDEKKYSDSEVNYKKSLDIKKDSKYGHFNLGNAYYKQEKYDDAITEYASLAGKKNLDKQELHQIYHNLGNAYLQSKKYEESIKEYKKSLKLNSKDEDTRYNLAYAQAMLKKDQQQNKQKQNQQDNKNQDQKQQQSPQDQQKQEQEKQQQQQKQSQKISKEDAEKILRALNNDEKNIQKKMQKKEEKKVRIEKNW